MAAVALEQPGGRLDRVAPAARIWSSAARRLTHDPFAVLGSVIVVGLVLTAVLADRVAPHGYAQQFVGEPFQGPSPAMPFGADALGRDVLSRVIFGARISLAIGLSVQGAVVMIGVTIGAVAGYAGGWLDGLLMRFTDVVYAVPDLLLVILLLAVLGRSETNVFAAIALASWPTMARLVRAQFLALKREQYIEAARLAGASNWWLVTRHLLPNALGPVIVAVTLGIPSAILTEAVLAFLGLGAPPPLPSWGSLVSEALGSVFSDPLLEVFPSLAISVSVLGFMLLGDALRDALDPHAGGWSGFHKPAGGGR